MTRALRRVFTLYLLAQVLSWLVLRAACSEIGRAEFWLYGALGPLAAFEAIPRFRYHSLIGNLGFVALCLAILVAPFAYVLRPARATYVVSAVALGVWVLFGLGFGIRHM